MIIRRTSQKSGKVREMDLPVTAEQIAAWENGTMIQKAMPQLTPDQREFIISGVTKEEWDEMWKDEGLDEDQ